MCTLLLGPIFPCQNVFFPIRIYASLPPLVGKSGWTINLPIKGGDNDLSPEMCFLIVFSRNQNQLAHIIKNNVSIFTTPLCSGNSGSWFCISIFESSSQLDTDSLNFQCAFVYYSALPQLVVILLSLLSFGKNKGI